MDLETLKKEVDLLWASGVDPKTKIVRNLQGRSIEIQTISRKDEDKIVFAGDNRVSYLKKKEEVLTLW